MFQMKLGSKPKKFGLFVNSSVVSNKPNETIKAKYFKTTDTNESESNLTLRQQQNQLSKQKKIEKQLKLIEKNNPNIFNYDAEYSKMEKERQNKKNEISKEKKDRKVRYITKLKEQSKIREKRLGIIEERKNMKEREKTDHLFENENKEEYITRSFKKYLEDTKIQEIKDLKKEKNEKTIENSKNNNFAFYDTLYRMRNNYSKKRSGLSESLSKSRSRSRSRDRNDNSNDDYSKFKEKEKEYYREKYLKELNKKRKTKDEVDKELNEKMIQKCKKKNTDEDVQQKRARYLERRKLRKKNAPLNS